MSSYPTDTRVKRLSISDFLKVFKYLYSFSDCTPWNEINRPEIFETYYSLQKDRFIYLEYSFKQTNYGMKTEEYLECIYYAYRDGKTEYELINKHIEKLTNQLDTKTGNQKIKLKEKINKIKKILLEIPPFEKPTTPQKKKFENYLIDTGQKAFDIEFSKKFVVLDLETNGIRKSVDDVLSLSIYDPSTGICYNRFLPLHMQPLVLTGWIHHITSESLEKETHMDQEEFDNLTEFFDLKNKTILVFSGGKGNFDPVFLYNYLKRHNVCGFDDNNFKFKNIKRAFPSAPFGFPGFLSKDNLCIVLGINRISDIHSSLNDCLLERQLFEKAKNKNYLFIGGNMYEFNKDYIIPVSYLLKYSDLAKHANINLPRISSTANKLFSMSLSKKALKDIKKYSGNITGVTIEHAINSCLKVNKHDDWDFLAKNRSKLTYIGTFPNQYFIDINVYPLEDGTFKAANKEDEEFVNEVNENTTIIIDEIKPVVEFIKDNIFLDSEIQSQELVISDDNKVLALCDLSNDSKILEIKTFGIKLTSENKISSGYIEYQLYYQSQGRESYLLTIDFVTHTTRSGNKIVDDVLIDIYKIDLEIRHLYKDTNEYQLDDIDTNIIRMMKENEFVTKNKLMTVNNINELIYKVRIQALEDYGYIKQEGTIKPRWIVLRDVDDNITRFIKDVNGIQVIND